MTVLSQPAVDPVVRWWKHLQGRPGYHYVLYETISLLYGRSKSWRAMNYGYAPVAGRETVELDPQDEPDRFSLQLYHFVASAHDLRGKDLLEVASGRGAGTSFVHRHFRPQSTTGLDRSRLAVASCRKAYPLSGLTFRAGNAVALPFAADSFDAVMTVEATHAFPDRGKFFAEAYRVVRPGGVLLCSDLLPPHAYDPLASQMTNAGWKIREQRVINAEVVRALEFDNARRLALIEQTVPRFLQTVAKELVATTDSHDYRKLQTGRSLYFRIVAVKAGRG